ncbi:MAG TPA: hypothetical protein VNL71_24690 [Chloroflexota bacterium]|nr:hypothetical protein [Chloroflexota bacterium]
MIEDAVQDGPPMGVTEWPRAKLVLVGAWFLAACGLGLCAVLLTGIAAWWISVLPLILGVGALARTIKVARVPSRGRLAFPRPLASSASLPDLANGALFALSDNPRPEALPPPVSQPLAATADVSLAMVIPMRAASSPEPFMESANPPAALDGESREAPLLWLGLGCMVLIGAFLLIKRARG